MTYGVTDSCIECKDMDRVDVCPAVTPTAPAPDAPGRGDGNAPV